MYSRWYHPPTLHSPAPGHTKKVGWLELFYDLIYVASIIQLGNGLSQNAGLGGFLAFAALFTPLWLAWTSFTFYMNRYSVDDFLHRSLVFLQMFAVGAVAIAVPDVMTHGKTWAFAVSFGTVRLMMAVIYARTWHQNKESRELGSMWFRLFAVEAGIWYISALLPAPWVYVAWAVAVGMAFSIPLSRHSRDLSLKYPPDIVHFTERYGLLVIIVLGESFVKVLSELAATGSGLEVYAMGCAAMLVTCTMWWIYFDDVAGSRIKNTPGAPFIWIYTHLPLTMAVTAVGVAVKKVAMLDPGVVASSPKYYWLLCGSLCLALLCVGLIDLVTERREASLSDQYTIRLRAGSALLVLLLPVVAMTMAAWVFITLLLVFCIGQVLLDISLAPQAMDQDELHHAEHRELASFLRRGKEGEDQDIADDAHAEDAGHGHDAATRPGAGRAPGKQIRRDFTETVRRGTPNELRRDFYFFVIEGSWGRFFGWSAILFLFINVVFAALYMLEPGSVYGLEDGDFPEAFYFSVQTMTTIGYGSMVPATDYGNVIMTVEAGMGMLVVALLTGLMFAKASHAKSSVLFAEEAVITMYDGEPTLMLRVANARGNEVVEASISVSALMHVETPEGHRMRRIYDLELERKTSPIFSMSWTVMHKIGDASPINRCRWGDPEDDLLGIVVTLMGHDATYGQTIHARHIYYPEHFKVGHSYVDVLSELEDGRLMIDYAIFHDTTPNPPEIQAALQEHQDRCALPVSADDEPAGDAEPPTHDDDEAP